jgi:hypothetical protein
MKRIVLCLLLLASPLPALAETPEQTAAKIVAGVELMVKDPADQLRNLLAKQQHYHDRGLVSRKPEDFRISIAIAARMAPLIGDNAKAREQMLSYQERSQQQLCSLVSRGPACTDISYNFDLNLDREALKSNKQLRKAREEALSKAQVADPVYNKNIGIKNRWLAAIYLDALGESERSPKKRMQAAEELKAIIGAMQPGTHNWARASNYRGQIFMETALQHQGKSTLKRLETAQSIFENALARMASPSLIRQRAMIHSNLANTLISISHRRNNLELATAAYEHAQQAANYYDRYVDPWSWAFSIGNRGVARILMAELSNKPEWRKQAIEDMKAASKMLRKQQDKSGKAYLDYWIRRASSPINKKKGSITL